MSGASNYTEKGAITPTDAERQSAGFINATKGGGTIFAQHDEIVQLVRESNPKAANFFILNVRKNYIRGGDLISVGFDEDGMGRFNNVIKMGKNLELFRNDTQLIDGLVRYANKPPLLQSLFSFEVIPGVIAVSLVCCIIFLVVRDPANPKIPEILSSGLALILGFYFGKSSSG